MKFNRFHRFATIAFCAIFALPAFAGVTGTIGGRVLDSKGALIPNASVTLTSIETSATLTVTTKSDGLYQFLALPIGHYDLVATAQGFQGYSETHIRVDANDVLRIDVGLKPGNQKQNVEVRANSIRVETTSTQMGQVIGAKTIVAIPLNGRSYTDLLTLQPGVAPASTGSNRVSFIVGLQNGTQGAGNISVSGAREDMNGFVVNGGSVEDPFTNGTSVIPVLDSIAEFRLLTNNFDAEYGHFGGGLVNVVTKSGTNQLHGDAYVFVRNQNLDANNFFSTQRGEFSQYQPGGTVGGPLKKDKLFFFVGYQATRATIGQSTGQVVVPTADDRAGIFDPASLKNNVNGAYLASILSQRLGTTVTTGEPYADVFPGGVIPQAAWSAPSSNLLKYFPQPNLQGYYTALDQTVTREDRGGVRIDYIGSKLGSISAYYFVDDANTTDAFGGKSIPGWPSGTIGRDQQLIASDTRTLGSSAVNVVHVNYMRYTNDFSAATGGPTAASIGIVGLAQLAPYPGIPGLSISGIGTSIGMDPNIASDAADVYEASEHFSKVLGSHNVTFGGEFDVTQWYASYINPGNIKFRGSETGNAFADFLLGTPSTFSQETPALNDSRTKYAGIYGQDSWRVRPNLTLNYGLRWEVSLPWYDKHNHIATFIPGEQSVIFPTAPAGLVYPGDKGVPRGISPTQWKNFSPRVGIAWLPNGSANMSIRASYGIFYTSMASFGSFFYNAPPPYQILYTTPFPTFLDHPYTSRITGVTNDPFPFTTPVQGDTNIDFAQFEPIAGYPFVSTTAQSPYMQDYSLSLQQQLARQMVLTLSYVGSEGHHLLANTEVNPGNPALCLSLSQPSGVAPGTPTCGPGGEDGTYIRPNGTVVASTRPYGPNFGSTPMLFTIANSSWNGLEASLRYQSNIADFMAGYTWGKSMDNSSSLSDPGLYPFNHNFTRGLSTFDVNQNFVFSYNVNFPFARLAGNRWTKLTDGWGLSGVTHIATGFPIRIAEGDDQSLLGMNGVINGGPDVPDYKPGPLELGHGPLSGKPYFNTSLFSRNVLGQFGNSNPRFFHGPGIFNSDTALLKNMQLTERIGLQFRLEMFNVFNHPQFRNPDGYIDDGPAQFGIIHGADAPRIGQVALKTTF